MQKTLSLLLLAFALSLFAQSPVNAQELTTQEIDQVRKVLGLEAFTKDSTVLDLANERIEKFGTLSCRQDGFSCKSSIECCSYCMSGVCGGQKYNKPDGTSCQSSIECKSYCMSGVCGGQKYNKPDGAECKSSIECKSYCMKGRCGGV